MTIPETFIERPEAVTKEMAAQGAEAPTALHAVCGPSVEAHEDPTHTMADAQADEGEPGDFLLTICDGEVLAWTDSRLSLSCLPCPSRLRDHFLPTWFISCRGSQKGDSVLL